MEPFRRKLQETGLAPPNPVLLIDVHSLIHLSLLKYERWTVPERGMIRFGADDNMVLHEDLLSINGFVSQRTAAGRPRIKPQPGARNGRDKITCAMLIKGDGTPRPMLPAANTRMDHLKIHLAGKTGGSKGQVKKESHRIAANLDRHSYIIKYISSP